MPPGARSIFQRFLGAAPGRAPAALAPPGVALYVIGDVHGRVDLLHPLLRKIAYDAARLGPDETRELIFLGDYVDRGPDSRGVIELILTTIAETDFWTVTALKGNHEAALLEFLDDPTSWPMWSPFGARETLSSYGVDPPDWSSGEDDWARASRELGAAMHAAHKALLRGLDLAAERGDYPCAHAGVRPGIPLDRQVEQDLLWIRDDFLRSERRLAKVIVHGHTPADEAYLGEHRIGLDTGAYATSVLTAVRLKDAERTLIQVRGAEDKV
jgi:serine/threonine protein phosphatase 1